MKKVFRVNGMQCHSCELLIKDSLEEAKGVISASASYEDGIVSVVFDESIIREDDIIKVLRKEGYGI